MSETAVEKDTTGPVPNDGWVQAPSVTGRPNDVAPENSTMAERAAARRRDGKQVTAEEVEDKAVTKAKRK